MRGMLKQEARLEDQLVRTLQMLRATLGVWPIAVGRSGGFHVPRFYMRESKEAYFAQGADAGDLKADGFWTGHEISLWDYRGVPGAWAYVLREGDAPREFFPEAPSPRDETDVFVAQNGDERTEDALAVLRELGYDVEALADKIRAAIAIREGR